MDRERTQYIVAEILRHTLNAREACGGYSQAGESMRNMPLVPGLPRKRVLSADSTTLR